MSAKCPACKWELPVFGKRPQRDSTMNCPGCKAELIFRTRSLVVKSVFMPLFFGLLALMRINEGNSIGYMMLGLCLALIMFVVWVQLERFELVVQASA